MLDLHFISTHALTEGDMPSGWNYVKAFIFQLTPSRRATPALRGSDRTKNISTHALTEGDITLIAKKN